MNYASRLFFVIFTLIVAGLCGIFIAGCAVSGCGNPNTTSTMSDSNNNSGSFNEPYQPIHIEQASQRPPKGILVRKTVRPRRIPETI